MRINKNIIIAFSIIILSLIIGWLASPYLIELYFDNQPIYSISESESKLVFDKNMVNESNIPLGQSIVLYGYLDDHFILHDTKNYNEGLKLIPVMDKINCIPFKSGNYKIVGAYNLVNDNNEPLSPNRYLKFYVVWILGGCN